MPGKNILGECQNLGLCNEGTSFPCAKSVDADTTILTATLTSTWNGSASGPPQGVCEEERTASVSATKTVALVKQSIDEEHEDGRFYFLGCGGCCVNKDDVIAEGGFFDENLVDAFDCKWCDNPFKQNVRLSAFFALSYDYCLKKVVVSLTGNRNMGGISGICNTLANCSGAAGGVAYFDHVSDLIGTEISFTESNTCNETEPSTGSANATFTVSLIFT